MVGGPLLVGGRLGPGPPGCPLYPALFTDVTYTSDLAASLLRGGRCRGTAKNVANQSGESVESVLKVATFLAFPGMFASTFGSRILLPV